MKAFSTKWLFSNGIEEFECEDCGESMIRLIDSDRFHYPVYLHGEGKEWHKTKDSAIAKAEEMRIKKLQALDKQIKKISAMKF